MTITVTLNEDDIKEAVGMWLEKRGLRAKGKPTVRHFAGDVRDPSYTTIDVAAEAVSHG